MQRCIELPGLIEAGCEPGALCDRKTAENAILYTLVQERV